MGYANGQSNFAGGGADDAYWIYQRAAGVQNVCSTSAADVVSAARSALGMSASPQSWSSSMIVALRAQAAALANEDAAWQPVASRLAAQGPQITRLDVLFAIYLAYYRPNGLRFDALLLPVGATLPAVDAEISGAPVGVACFDPATDPDPSLSLGDRHAVVAASVYGIRLHAGESPPAPVRGGLTGGYAGPSDKFVLIALGAAALGAYYVWTTSPEYKRR